MLNIILLFCISLLPISDYAIDSIFVNTDKYAVICEYPDISDTSFTEIEESIKQYATEVFNENKDFMIEVEDLIDPEMMKYHTELRIEDYYTTKTTISILYILNSYTGGAHGIHSYYTFNYNKESQTLFILKDIISQNDLKTISEYCRKNIADQKEGNTEDYSGLKNDGDLLAGTKPKWENFETFVITENGIRIIFNEYEVAPYFMGAFEVLVPSDILKSGDN